MVRMEGSSLWYMWPWNKGKRIPTQKIIDRKYYVNARKSFSYNPLDADKLSLPIQSNSTLETWNLIFM